MAPLCWIDNSLSVPSDDVRLGHKVISVNRPSKCAALGSDALETGNHVHSAAALKAIKGGDFWLASCVYPAVRADIAGLETAVKVGPILTIA